MKDQNPEAIGAGPCRGSNGCWRWLCWLIGGTLLLGLGGCAELEDLIKPQSPSAASIGSPVNEAIRCSEPRPTICTMEYRPVCATLSAGGTATYASPCNACADIAVVSHTPAACEIAER